MNFAENNSKAPGKPEIFWNHFFDFVGFREHLSFLLKN